jgi:oligopeptide transport system substrate-binding protein
VQAVAQQLRDTLGLDVNLQGIPFKELLTREKADDASGLFRAAWTADYPSADAFLRPLLSKASLPPGDNRGRYVNDRFDSLLDQASRTSDGNQRISYIKEAERIAIGDDQALIPLWYRTQYRVFSNRFKNVDMDFFENPTLADISLA